MTTSIEQHMTTELISFSPEDDILHAMRVLLDKKISGAPVLDESEKLVGILSMKDCMEIVYNTAYHQDWGGKVEQYMSREVEHIEADTSILTAAEKFLNSNFRRFPVLRNGQLVGQISRHDILRALDQLYIQSTQ
ncbi:MAG: CBS domain-containing protein [Gammaproteobacteria bacterium]|nr:MAG: CBS domain-containing protein [Gammaproteobacteria bacterium]